MNRAARRQFQKQGVEPSATNGKSSISFTDAEQAVFRTRDLDISKAKHKLADIQFQIMRLESDRMAAAQELARMQDALLVTLKESAKAHGVDMDAPDAGTWTFKFETMTFERVS